MDMIIPRLFNSGESIKAREYLEPHRVRMNKFDSNAAPRLCRSGEEHTATGKDVQAEHKSPDLQGCGHLSCFKLKPSLPQAAKQRRQSFSLVEAAADCARELRESFENGCRLGSTQC
jgi:hypothetical protein